MAQYYVSGKVGLEAAKDAKLRKFVFASTSSIYGDAESDGTPETAVPKPISPYGVSKLAAEHLCIYVLELRGRVSEPTVHLVEVPLAVAAA